MKTPRREERIVYVCTADGCDKELSILSYECIECGDPYCFDHAHNLIRGGPIYMNHLTIGNYRGLSVPVCLGCEDKKDKSDILKLLIAMSETVKKTKKVDARLAEKKNEEITRENTELEIVEALIKERRIQVNREATERILGGPPSDSRTIRKETEPDDTIPLGSTTAGSPEPKRPPLPRKSGSRKPRK